MGQPQHFAAGQREKLLGQVEAVLTFCKVKQSLRKFRAGSRRQTRLRESLLVAARFNIAARLQLR